jgi:hypothetical protein
VAAVNNDHPSVHSAELFIRTMDIELKNNWIEAFEAMNNDEGDRLASDMKQARDTPDWLQDIDWLGLAWACYIIMATYQDKT